MKFARHDGYRVGLMAVAVCLLIATATLGCAPDTDDWQDPVHGLHIRVPGSATVISQASNGDDARDAYRMEWLMPDAQWRSYAEGYYPRGFDKPPMMVTEEIMVPAACIEAFRGSGRLQMWLAADQIAYRDTGKTAERTIYAVPECQPGLALVAWSLERKRTGTG